MSNTPQHLMFHYLHKPGNKQPYSISAIELQAQLERLIAQGMRPVSLAEWMSESPPDADCFTVSFDDAHRSVVEHAAPVLRALGVPATLFVPTACIGATEWALTWSELAELARMPGWTLGAHGHLHRRMSWRLYGEDHPAHRARLVADVQRCAERMETHLGARPAIFAYPYGDAPRVAQEVVAEAGFALAVTVATSAEWGGDRMQLPRVDAVPVEESEDATPGMSVIVPACDRLPVLEEVVRRLVDQTYPSERYEVLVVDDGSSMDLALALERFGGAVRVLRLPESDATFRAGQARQLGVDTARFDIAVFLDADVAVDRDFLWAVAWCHRRQPDAVVLGYLSGYNLHDIGQVHLLDDIRLAERLTGDEVPIIPDRSREPLFAACLDNLGWLENPWELAYTGNFSVSRQLLERAGGFSRAFSGWGFEDVDLGIRLHGAGGQFCLSRWAVGYHLAEPSERVSDAAPNNPFRRTSPSKQDFRGALRNLDTLASLHPNHPGVQAFVAGVRQDVNNTCEPSDTVGVEVGAPLGREWPFAPLHKRWPGGRDLHDIADRLAYARKVGATHIYLLGGDVLLHPQLGALLAQARGAVNGRIVLESSGLAVEAGLAELLAESGVHGVALEVLAGGAHPTATELSAMSRTVRLLSGVGIEVSAKLVVGDDAPDAVRRALSWIDSHGLSLWDAYVLGPAKIETVSSWLPPDVAVTGVAADVLA